MQNIYLVQVNNTYGLNCFLPYSVGLLQSYALTKEDIRKNYVFKDLFYLREDIDKVISRIDSPSVVGISCYIWNWQYSITLAEQIKSKYPNCLIVLGGPSVPLRSKGFFIKHKFVDILVHYEGEITFTEVLLEKLKDKPDYTLVEGISMNLNGETHQTKFRERLEDLDIVPSPYLTGVFDEIIKHPYDFHASQETDRGCPYSCTFCDWGSNVLAKVKTYNFQRLIDEIEWFGKHKIELLYNCDANYGLFPRDIELTKKMVEIKEKYGFPKKFRAAYAKNSNNTVYEIAKILNKSEMNKGITLSFQSMNDSVLTIVKRKNIKIENFKTIMNKYNAEGIATYSEMIIGLPGETYETFCDGLDLLIECGQHDSIQVYNCEILPNAEMNDPMYRQIHQIETVRSPVLFFHGTPSQDIYREHYELVVSTATLSIDDWIKTHLFSWIIQCCHCLSLTQYLAIFFRNQHNISYKQFYQSLLKFAENNKDTLIGKARQTVIDNLHNILSCKEWGIIDHRFGDIIWPLEEGTFLSLIVNKDQFYDEMRHFIKSDGVLGVVDDTILDDVIEYQKNIIKDPFNTAVMKFSLSHDLHDYFAKAVGNINNTPVHNNVEYTIRAIPYNGNLEKYAQEVIWYGRKGGKFRHTDISTCLNADQAH